MHEPEVYSINPVEQEASKVSLSASNNKWTNWLELFFSLAIIYKVGACSFLGFFFLVIEIFLITGLQNNELVGFFFEWDFCFDKIPTSIHLIESGNLSGN